MNNLSARERVLLKFFLFSLPIGLLIAGWIYFNGARESRMNTLVEMEQEKKRLQDLKFDAEVEADRMDVYNMASLSEEVTRYNEQYQAYILKMIEEAGLTVVGDTLGRLAKPVDVKEVLAPGSPRKDELDTIYTEIKISELKVKGNTEQLTKFLYAFYDAAILQRVDKFVVVQEARDPEDTELVVTMSLSAISLPTGPEEKAFDQYARGRVGKSYQEVESLVVARDIFGPPNEAPSFSSGVLSQNLKVGERFQISNFSARDAETDKLAYELLSTELDDVTLEPRSDGRSARISGPRIDKPGTYHVKVRVSDNRIPKLSEEDTIVVKVEEDRPREAPIREPKKVAPETYITSLLETRNGDLILRMKNEDDRFELKLGETFELDGDTWKVIEFRMARRMVVLQRGEERLVYKLGSTLDQPEEETETVTVATEY